jgi:hypothetical protein
MAGFAVALACDLIYHDSRKLPAVRDARRDRPE